MPGDSCKEGVSYIFYHQPDDIGLARSKAFGNRIGFISDLFYERFHSLNELRTDPFFFGPLI